MWWEWAIERKGGGNSAWNFSLCTRHVLLRKREAGIACYISNSFSLLFAFALIPALVSGQSLGRLEQGSDTVLISTICTYFEDQNLTKNYFLPWKSYFFKENILFRKFFDRNPGLEALSLAGAGHVVQYCMPKRDTQGSFSGFEVYFHEKFIHF